MSTSRLQLNSRYHPFSLILWVRSSSTSSTFCAAEVAVDPKALCPYAPHGLATSHFPAAWELSTTAAAARRGRIVRHDVVRREATTCDDSVKLFFKFNTHLLCFSNLQAVWTVIFSEVSSKQKSATWLLHLFLAGQQELSAGTLKVLFHI